MTDDYNILFHIGSSDVTPAMEALASAGFVVSATDRDSEYIVTHEEDV